MKHLLFNAVVLASLGYLFAAEGRIDIPFMDDAPDAATPAVEAPAAPVTEIAIQEPVQEEVVPEVPEQAETLPETATAAVAEPVIEQPVVEEPIMAEPVIAEPEVPAASTQSTRVAVTDAPFVEPPVTSYDPNAGVISPPPASDVPQTAVAEAPVAPVQTAATSEAVTETVTESVTLEPLPELGQAESVATLPQVTIDPNASAMPASSLPSGMADPLDLALGYGGNNSVQVADGQTMMTPSERVRDLDRMIEDMELFYLEHTLD